MELPSDALPLGASFLKLLGGDPDVLHVAAEHEIDLEVNALFTC